MTDVTTDDAAEPALSAADEQLLKELTERARAGGLIPGQRHADTSDQSGDTVNF